MSTFGHALADWNRLPWRIHRAYQAAKTPDDLARARSDAGAWLRECESLRAETPMERAIRVKSLAMPSQSLRSAREESETGQGASAPEHAPEAILSAAGWAVAPRKVAKGADPWWRCPVSGDDYPQWRAVQVVRGDQ